MCTFSHAYVLFHTSLCRNYSTDIRVRARAATLSHSAFLQLRTENLFSLCQANIESVKALYFQEIKKGINSLHQVDLHQFAKTSCQSLKKKNQNQKTSNNSKGVLPHHRNFGTTRTSIMICSTFY